jgi:hypothetical protein
LDWGYLQFMKFPPANKYCCSCKCRPCNGAYNSCQRQFQYGHRFDGTLHSYQHKVYFKAKEDK